ncbi:alkane 1-monooxygenase [Croceicoccus estronivorus]|uniref:LLM class flavin-dependent oxidoreductase n=1 Tax=Croceicoccus estronivorus TaxID=1172626 RepID=UPI00083361B5|nr:LLM class flavin-dependent oxidoreductase [Croceicoccus estronivorus]OCC23900.1 alkane 1-monooxygenase [Croceicoccus estronivorus]
MIPLSVLDTVPVSEGSGPHEALQASATLAKLAEDLGYARLWVAEHHSMDGIGGAATSVVLAHIGHATSTIRIGAGGVMLPNHNPFVIAEQFGTLDALFPGRVDLGLGRAPGADSRIAHAMRKNIAQAAEYFPQDVMDLRTYFDGQADVPLRPNPGWGANVEMWMLGSSLFGAQLAAQLGMPYAFASHFSPDHLDAALSLYRERFHPSEHLAAPHVMVGMTVFAAETDRDAQTLASSQEQMYVALRTNLPGKIRPPIPDYRESLPMQAQAMLAHVGQASAVGSPATVREAIGRFIERTQADELIVSGATFDPAARRHSLQLTMEALSAEA